MGNRGKREFIQILRLMEVFPETIVAAAALDAIQIGAIGFDAVKQASVSLAQCSIALYYASCPHFGTEWRELSAQTVESPPATRHPISRSRNRKDHRRFVKTAVAPAEMARVSKPGRPRRVEFYAQPQTGLVFLRPTDRLLLRRRQATGDLTPIRSQRQMSANPK
jgi:hypothetical protein